MASTLNMIIKTLEIIIFSDKGIDEIKKTKFNALLAFFLAVFIQSIPSSYSNPTNYLVNFGLNFVIIAFIIAIMIWFLFFISKILKSNVKFKKYFMDLSIVIFILSFLSILTAFILINFGILIGYPEVAFKLVQGGFLSYYLFVVFGWCSERLANFDNLKGVILGLVSLSLIYFFHLVIATIAI